MSEKIHQPSSPYSRVIEISSRHAGLTPCINLAKHILDVAVCEVNVLDPYYVSEEVRGVKKEDKTHIDSICYDTIRRGIYEIEDLSQNARYKDHSAVKNDPSFRYYCGVKLTTSDGMDIGSLGVLDTQSGQASDSQKEQLLKLARLVMDTIEYETKNRGISRDLEALKEGLYEVNGDVRKPINGIAGMAELSVGERETLELPDKEFQMMKESGEILDLIDGVLEDLESENKESKKKDSIHLCDIIDELKLLYDPPAKVKDLSLTITNHADPKLKITHSLSLKLLQATSNLISNVVKFTPEKGSLEVIVDQVSENGEMFNIKVSNKGNHMSLDQKDAFNNGVSVSRSFEINGHEDLGE